MSLDIARLGFDVDSSALRAARDDLRDFSETAEKTDDKVRRASDGIERSLSSAAGRSATAWAKFRESFGGANGLVAAVSASGVSLAVSRMVEVARASEEAQALFDQVFQGSAASVREWSNVMAEQINRSAYDLQSQAAQFQQVLAAMVPDRSQAAQMSTTLAGLAQDISAFYDISEGDALGKLRSGLTGETEPLKALGIVLSATSVEAKALELGLAGAASEMTEADKVAARYALIMQLTADAQGAATREAASLSNQQKGLSGALNDAYRSLGQNLLPIVTQATVALADMARAFNALSPETQKFIAYAAGLAAVIGPALTGLGLMSMAIPPITAALGLLLSPVGLAVAAIAGLTAAGVYLYQNWEEISARYPALQQAVDAIAGAFNWLRETAANVVNALRPVVSFLADNFVSAVKVVAALLQGDFIGAFVEMRDQVQSNMRVLADQALPWAKNIVSQIIAGLAGLYQAGLDAIAELGRGLRDSVSGLISDAKQWGADIAAGLSNGVSRGAERVKATGKWLAGQIKGAFTDEVEIQSPSRVFMRYGEFIDQGLAVGIERGARAPVQAIEAVAETLIRKTERLADDIAGAFGNWMADGLRSFKDFAREILSSFQNMISDMIATAVRNPIRIAVQTVMGGFGGAGGAMAGVPGIPGGGILGKIGAGIGTAISGAMSGFGSVVGGLFSGGLGGAAGALTTALGGATSGLAGLATAAGAIAAPLAAVAAVFSFFKSKTTELDRGLRVTVDGMDALVETFRKTETRRFWGLSKKRRTSYEEADAEIADPIESAIGKVQQSVLDMAASIGTGSAAFAQFAYQFKLSTKDMTDEEALQAIQAEMGKFGDAFAAMIPDIADFAKEGEGIGATLERLSTALGAVNGVLGDLGLELYRVSVRGADAASQFAELFGGLDQFAQASSAYYEAFYSDAERFARLQEVSNKAIRDAGLAVPATREAYRRLVEAQDLTTEAGRKAAAVLLQLAPAFDQIYDAAEATRAAAAQAIADANASRASLLDSLLTDQQRAAQAQAEIAATFAALNMTVPTTLDGLRAIIAGLDLTGEAGRDALARIAGIADALRDRLTPVQQAAERVTSGGGSSGRDGVAEERERLERQILQLQGNTAELRRRELAALNPANRALQEMVWRLEDAKAAMDSLSTDKFATLVDYELARSRQANSANSPAAVTPEKKAEEARQRQDSAVLIEMRDYMRTSVNEIHRLVRETREMRMLQEGGAP